MKLKTSHIAPFSVAMLCSCTTQQPPALVFGEQVSFGIEIGANPGSEGIDFTLGYKDLDVAIVPVSAMNSGTATNIIALSKGEESNWRDALSVFGQFKSKGGSTNSSNSSKAARNVSLGRFFATGLAATSLAEGYQLGWNQSDAAGSKPDKIAKNNSALTSSSVVGGAPLAETSNSGTKKHVSDKKPSSGEQDSALSAPSHDTGSPYTPPLVFAQTNTLGIGFSSSIADQGVHFTLGYTGRDIAFVPVMVRSRNGDLTRLGGCIAPAATECSSKEESDAFSVLGQFEVNTETQNVDFGLGRFFTTGVAARKLADGFKGAISRELKEGQGQPVATQAK